MRDWVCCLLIVFAIVLGVKADVSAQVLAWSVIEDHKGPVLDVSLAGECRVPPPTRVARYSVTYPIDAGDADERAMLDEDFLARVSGVAALSAAKVAGETILVACCIGQRSEGAVAALRHVGFMASSLPGGWQSLDTPPPK